MIEAALIILVPIVLYLPGHFLGGSMARKGDGWTESTLLRISCAIAVATPILVLLALMWWFRAPVLLGCFAAATVAAWALARRGGRPGRRPFERWDLALYALVVASFSLYVNPAEYVLKDRDPGVYAVVAAKLARTGEILTRDPLVGAVSAFHEFADGAKHSGFFIRGDDLLVPQFFPGSFVLLGLGNMLGGSWAGLYVVPVFGALAVGMAFLLGSELFGRWAGLIGAALLATSYTQVWWSRYPSSEVLTQFFILGGSMARRQVRARQRCDDAVDGGSALRRGDAGAGGRFSGRARDPGSRRVRSPPRTLAVALGVRVRPAADPGRRGPSLPMDRRRSLPEHHRGSSRPGREPAPLRLCPGFLAAPGAPHLVRARVGEGRHRGSAGGSRAKRSPCRGRARGRCVGLSAYLAWPVYGVRELAGAAEGIESLENAVPPSRVIYAETPAEDYAATLDYLYRRPVLVYHRDQLQKELPKLREAGLLEDAAFMTVEQWPKPVFPGLKLRKVGEERVSFLRLEDGFKEVPREAYVEQQGFKIFELEAG